MKKRVCAVTVAYNNPDELARLLSSLENQDSSVSGLIIIDNSDDSHSAENQKLFDLYSKKHALACYHKTETNVGSAGGFRRGMKVAHENGFDWVWLLDQDGAVSPDCLNELLKHYEDGDILCPNIVDIGQPDASEPMVYTQNFLGGLYLATRRASNRQIHAFGTHAVLISKKALDTIGYYDNAYFFVGHEDTDYGYRAVQAGLAIFFVEGAQALHPAPTDKKLKTLLAQLNITILPALMDYLADLHLEESPCLKTQSRSIAPFSKAYLESKNLRSWQFAVALGFSECYALYCRVAGEKGIALTRTLRMYVKCLSCSVKKDWPYEAIEQLCREVLK